jgi:rod shape-determining protein MreC
VDAIAQGAAGDTCRLEHVPLLAEVAQGDRVLTSGLDLVHVRGLLVGTVEQVEGNGVHQEIVVHPAVDFTRLEHVLVVTSTSRAKEQARAAVRETTKPKREERR